MQTTYKEQIEAIRKMRKVADEFYPEYSLALNDAASSIAVLKWQEERPVPGSDISPLIDRNYEPR